MTGSYEQSGTPPDPNTLPDLFASRVELGPDVSVEDAYVRMVAAVVTSVRVMDEYPWDPLTLESDLNEMLISMSDTLSDMEQRQLGVALEHDYAIHLHQELAREQRVLFDLEQMHSRDLDDVPTREELLDAYIRHIARTQADTNNPYVNALALEVVNDMVYLWLTEEGGETYGETARNISKWYMMLFAIMFDAMHLMRFRGAELNVRAAALADEFIAPFAAEWRSRQA